MPAHLRFIHSFLIFFLAFAVTSVGAFAIFSTQAANQGNRISAGTLKLQIDSDPNTSGIQSGALFDLSGLVPGVVITKQINVLNTGSLPLQYNGSVVLSTGDEVLFTALQLKVGLTDGGSELYSGSIATFSGFNSGARLLNSGVSELVYLSVSLPDNADETLQGKSISVNFNFNSSQVP